MSPYQTFIQTGYVGRFAPSPSGSLHLGSLVAALGSFLQARSQHGQWLLRIEDLDPPRESPLAKTQIIEALHAHGLNWDTEILYQSQRHAVYQQQIDTWLNAGLAYRCYCTRRDIKLAGEHRHGFCNNPNQTGTHAIRLKIRHLAPVQFYDIRFGCRTSQTDMIQVDPIIQRSDGLFAYNLAVVLDDIFQGITEIVRGEDLLEVTPLQMGIYRLLSSPAPQYMHLPLVKNELGLKLSKQNHAPALDLSTPVYNICFALQQLGLVPPAHLQYSNLVKPLIEWSIEHWHNSSLFCPTR